MNPHSRAVTRFAMLPSVLAVVLAGMLALPVAAYARVARLEVSTAAEPKSEATMLYVTHTLTADAPLPARVSVAIPAGAVVAWAGELPDGTAGSGVKLQPSVTKGQGYDVLTLTLTRSRVAHVEVIVDDELPAPGSSVSPSLAYPMLEDTDVASVAVQVPAGSRVASATPGVETRPGPDGDTVYFIERTGLKAGDKLPISVSFTTPSDEPPVSGGSGAILPLFIVAVAVPVIVFIVRRTMRRAT